jgi:hypothetical protein
VAPGHVGVGHTLGRDVTEVAKAIDHLLGRATTDSELQAAETRSVIRFLSTRDPSVTRRPAH